MEQRGQNSSESSDDSSSPQLSAGGPRNSTHHKVIHNKYYTLTGFYVARTETYSDL